MKEKHANRICKFLSKMICHTIGMSLTLKEPKSSETRQRFPIYETVCRAQFDMLF